MPLTPENYRPSPGEDRRPAPVTRAAPEPEPLRPMSGVAMWWAILTVAAGLLAGIGTAAGVPFLVMLGVVAGCAAAVALVLLVVRAARALDELVRR